MRDGTFFLLALVGVAAATVWIAVYTVLLFRLGRWLATLFRMRPHQAQVYFLISCLSAVPCLGVFVLPVEEVVQGILAFGLWVLHAQPIGAGYWSGCEIGRQQDHRRFREQADAWLSEWESPPTWMSRDEDEG